MWDIALSITATQSSSFKTWFSCNGLVLFDDTVRRSCSKRSRKASLCPVLSCCWQQVGHSTFPTEWSLQQPEHTAHCRVFLFLSLQLPSSFSKHSLPKPLTSPLGIFSHLRKRKLSHFTECEGWITWNKWKDDRQAFFPETLRRFRRKFEPKFRPSLKRVCTTICLMRVQGVVLKREVCERTWKTRHFEQDFRLIFKWIFNEVLTFIALQTKTWKKCGNAFTQQNFGNATTTRPAPLHPCMRLPHPWCSEGKRKPMKCWLCPNVSVCFAINSKRDCRSHKTVLLDFACFTEYWALACYLIRAWSFEKAWKSFQRYHFCIGPAAHCKNTHWHFKVCFNLSK